MTPDADSVYNMADQDLESLIIRQLDMKNRSSDVWSIILSAKVAPRSLDVLEVLRHRTKSVMSSKTMEMEEFRSYCEKLGRAGRQVWNDGRGERLRSIQSSAEFLCAIDTARIQIRQKLKQYGIPDETAQQIRRALPALQRLVQQVLAHEEEMQDDPSQADEDLWDILDDTTVSIGRQRVTLREAHQAGWAPDQEEKGRE